MAAYHGHHKVIPFLLRAGSKIDAQSDDGRTPLHEASAQGHEEAVRELLKGGPNIHIRNSWLSPSPKVSEHGGKTALTIARDRGYGSIVSLLVHYQKSRWV